MFTLGFITGMLFVIGSFVFQMYLESQQNGLSKLVKRIEKKTVSGAIFLPPKAPVVDQVNKILNPDE